MSPTLATLMSRGVTALLNGDFGVVDPFDGEPG